MKDLDNTAIACSLTKSEFHDREATLLARFRSAVVEAEELQEGYTFRLPSDGKWIMVVAELIVAERECCPFLTFELAAAPNKGPLIVRVIGPPAAAVDEVCAKHPLSVVVAVPFIDAEVLVEAVSDGVPGHLPVHPLFQTRDVRLRRP
jgi:hypothetical protein